MYTGQLVMSGLLELEDPQWVRISITRCVVLVPTLLFSLLCRCRLDLPLVVPQNGHCSLAYSVLFQASQLPLQLAAGSRLHI